MDQISAYAPVDKCIYCASSGNEEGLRDEHIVPFSLGGEVSLPKASCARCEAITSAFEGRCARTNYGSFRIRQDVQTRRPKERPSHLQIKANIGETTETVSLHVSEVVATLPWFHFLPPGILRTTPVKEQGWTGCKLEIKTSDPQTKTGWSKSKAASFTFTQTFDTNSQARTLAKIAHALAVAELGLGAFEAWLPPYILGFDSHLSYLVGGVDRSLSPNPSRLHDLEWRVGPLNGEYLVAVDIRLFAQIGGPWARVVVGRSHKDFVLQRIAEGKHQIPIVGI